MLLLLSHVPVCRSPVHSRFGFCVLLILACFFIMGGPGAVVDCSDLIIPSPPDMVGASLAGVPSKYQNLEAASPELTYEPPSADARHLLEPPPSTAAGSTVGSDFDESDLASLPGVDGGLSGDLDDMALSAPDSLPLSQLVAPLKPKCDKYTCVTCLVKPRAPSQKTCVECNAVENMAMRHARPQGAEHVEALKAEGPEVGGWPEVQAGFAVLPR